MHISRVIQSNLLHSQRWWRREFVANTEHEEVIAHAKSEGELNARYVFMVGISCAIAMLGLLLSSPAVVIGAMLVSPLMGPIMSLGFSLCTVNIRQMRRALMGVIIGLIMAVGISWLIVTLSPISDVTPEILARTQPNLFDLLVAIFSGLAGGYSVIKRKGETIVGVAIATALMPPLAVVGYGLAVGAPEIYSGAFMLFMTNLLAIALSVTMLARWYGFGSRHNKRHTLWQTLLVLATFAALSLPLGVALKNIAYQTYVTQSSKNIIHETVGEGSRISLFNIAFASDDDAPLMIDSVVLTSGFKHDAANLAQQQLKTLLNKDVRLKLDQIVVAKEVINAPLAPAATENTLAPPTITAGATGAIPSNSSENMVQSLKQATFFETRFIEVSPERRQATIHPQSMQGLTLAILHQFESSLSQKFPKWQIRVIPPVQALPSIPFMIGSDSPTTEGETTLADIIWALKSWDVRKVEVIGFASTIGAYDRFNTTLAYRRATHIADRLIADDITATTRPEYHRTIQKRDEQLYGINHFHRVEVRLMREE